MTTTLKAPETGLARQSRIAALKREVQSGIPRICIARAVLMTASYRQTEGEPVVMRRAKALNHILSNMDIGITENELIVGDYVETPGKRGCPVLVEYSCDWLEEEMDHLTQRPNDKAFMSEADQKTLRELLPYWSGRTVKDRSARLMPDDLRAKYFEAFNVYSNEITRGGAGFGHIAVDYETVVTQGLDLVTGKARKHLAEMDISDPGQLSKAHFYRAVILTHEALIGFSHRYAGLARKLGETENNPGRKAELDQIAGICERVPARPARSFYEALQSVWFTHLALQVEGFSWGFTPGRLDQYLLPFYRKDIETGVLSREKAKELLLCFYIKLNSLALLLPSASAEYYSGWPMNENITLGGLNRDGGDATNDLSYLMLEADGELSLSQPETVVRVHKDTPRDFLIQACEVNKKCHGKLKFIGDEVAIQKLLNQGHTVEDARDYCIMGCFEAVVPGKSSTVGGGVVNLLLCLELALNDGVSTVSGKRLGPRTGNAAEFKSFEEMVQAYRKQVAYCLDLAVQYDCAIFQAHVDVAPTPFQSSLVRGCLETGVDITAAGAAFSAAWNSGIAAVNVGDSLAAIRKCVFDDRKMSMAELLDALHRNFEGKEEMRRELVGAPKFGNDDDYADLITRDVIAMFCDDWQRLKVYGGLRQPLAQLSGLPMVVPMGRLVGATPDGRRWGDPLADGGVSPAQGRNTRGAVATYRSVAKLDHVKLKFGEALNMTFGLDALKDDRAMQKFATMLQTYFQLGGFHVQFNIVTTEMLRDAQKNPEKHRDLLVRVATYSAYFIELNTEVQNAIIARAELGVS